MRIGWIVLAAIVACGGGGSQSAIVVPTQPDAGAPAASSASAPPPPPAPVEKKKPPQGSDGPVDGVGLVGEAGRIFPPSPEAMLFVNSVRIRSHPSADAFRRAITSILVGWDMFMPTDLVDPIKDIDWTIIAGSLMLGSTQQNVFLAHYNVPEPRADVITKQLAARLPKGKLLKSNSLTAEIDGAPRTYLRPKPGVLAIFPPDDAKSISEILAKADVPGAVRPNELMRIMWNGRRRGWATSVPHALKKLRMWITTGDDQKMRLSGEGECENEAAAEEAAAQLRGTIEHFAQSTFVRMAAGPLLDPSNLWADGRFVRYDAPLDERLLDVATSFNGP
jgi:hypothetical protein